MLHQQPSRLLSALNLLLPQLQILMVDALQLLDPPLLLRGKCLRLMLMVKMLVFIAMIFVKQCNLVSSFYAIYSKNNFYEKLQAVGFMI